MDHAARAEVTLRDVDEEAARDDLRHGLDAEVRDARGHGDLRDAVAVVRAVADLQVAERVEVGAELRRSRDDLGDPVHPVLADAAHVRVVRGGDERLVERPAGEDRHALVEHAAEVVEPALANRRERLEALRRVDVVEHPDLVVGAERRRPPRGRQELMHAA